MLCAPPLSRLYRSRKPCAIEETTTNRTLLERAVGVQFLEVHDDFVAAEASSRDDVEQAGGPWVEYFRDAISADN